MVGKTDKNRRAITTLLGAPTRIKGDVEFGGGLHVEGTIVGNVTGASDDAAISISEGGGAEGSVRAPEVVLSHAQRDEAGPAIPSRFLLRVQALLGEQLEGHEETAAIELARAMTRAPTAPRYVRPAPDPAPALAAKIPPLIEQGGYIPHIDHAVSPEISYDDFLYYLELKLKLTGRET